MWLMIIYFFYTLDLYDIPWLNISGNTENGYQRFWKFLLTEDYMYTLPSLPAGSLIVQEK